MSIVIIDHRQAPSDTRYIRLSACLEPLGTNRRCVRQVYGDPGLPVAPARLTADLLERTNATLAGASLVLLHCGDGQHLVPAVLLQTVLQERPCLLYTGGDPHIKAKELVNVCNPLMHVVLPRPFATKLPEDWPQSRDGVALKDCTAKILFGLSPRDAVRSVFGEPELDQILDDLYSQLNAGPGKVDLEAVRADRNSRLESHYENSRGWRDPALMASTGGT